MVLDSVLADCLEKRDKSAFISCENSRDRSFSMPSLVMRESAYCATKLANPLTANKPTTTAGMIHKGNLFSEKPLSNKG